MANQSPGPALDALVALIQGLGLFGLVSREIKHSAQLSPDEFPACFVMLGSQTPRHNVTSTTEYRTDVLVRVIYKPDETTKDQAMDKLLTVNDALAADDFTLSGTCISILPGPIDPPLPWPEQGGIGYLDWQYPLVYWRDF